jgi:hypothetical protein
VQCRRCGNTAPLPPPYRMLRDATRMSANDAARLDALCADISRPTSALKWVAIIVGYGIGILTLVVLAVGALAGAIVGLLGAAKAEVKEDGAAILIGICAFLGGMISVPFVGEWAVGLAVYGSTDGALTFATTTGMQWPIDAAVGGILYFLSVVPIAIAWRTKESVSAVKEIQGRLAAQPPASPGGACGCRNCGAALDTRPGALAARCVYCGTESLVAVPANVAESKRKNAGDLNQQVEAALASHEQTLRKDRRTMWLFVGLGPLLVPLLCGGGWLLHAIFGQ